MFKKSSSNFFIVSMVAFVSSPLFSMHKRSKSENFDLEAQQLAVQGTTKSQEIVKKKSRYKKGCSSALCCCAKSIGGWCCINMVCAVALVGSDKLGSVLLGTASQLNKPYVPVVKDIRPIPVHLFDPRVDEIVCRNKTRKTWDDRIFANVEHVCVSRKKKNN